MTNYDEAVKLAKDIEDGCAANWEHAKILAQALISAVAELKRMETQFKTACVDEALLRARLSKAEEALRLLKKKAAIGMRSGGQRRQVYAWLADEISELQEPPINCLTDEEVQCLAQEFLTLSEECARLKKEVEEAREIIDAFAWTTNEEWAKKCHLWLARHSEAIQSSGEK